MENQDSELPELKVGRLEPGFWLVAAIFIALALFTMVDAWFDPWPPPRPGEGTQVQLIIFLLSLALPLAGALRYFRIEMNAEGLRSRGLLGWRSARWDQVREYYLKPNHPPSGVLVTDAGRFNLGCHLMKRRDVRDFVRSHAVNARNHDWRLREAILEPCETRTFTYRKSHWSLIARTSAPLLLLISFTVWSGYNFTHGIAGFPYRPDRIWDLVPLSLPGLLMFGAVAIFEVSQYRHLARWAEDHGQESIEVSDDGIRWYGPGGEWAASWPEIQAYWTFQPNRPRMVSTFRGIVTAEGEVNFDIECLQDGRVLDHIVLRSLPPEARVMRPPEVGRPRRLNNSLVRFDYRSPSSSILLGFLTFLTNLMPLRLWSVTKGWMMIHDPIRTEQITSVVLFVMSAATVLIGWLGYLHSSVTLDASGIEQHSVHGQKRLQWDDVRAIRLVAQGTHILVHGEETSRMKVGALMADPRTLVEEILRRVPDLPVEGTTADGTARFHTISIHETR